MGFTYHQYAEFVPEASCQTCTLNASITGINRGYLQFLAAPSAGPVDQESGVIYQLMPITLSVIRDSIVQAVSLANPASTTMQQDSVAQWTDCSFLLVKYPINRYKYNYTILYRLYSILLYYELIFEYLAAYLSL